MLARYVLADLVRNPRRTLATVAGVIFGVGLFCGVLFFVDGLSASMTQRAVAPLPIDMQRIVTERAGGALVLTQRLAPEGPLARGDRALVRMRIENPQQVPANEVTIRSRPAPGLLYVPGSARIGGRSIGGGAESPFARGPASAGYNLGTLPAGTVRTLSYRVVADQAVVLDDSTVTTTFSSRESLGPLPANRPPLVDLAALARRITELPGVARASELSIGDLGTGALSAGARTAPGTTKIFGFDRANAQHDRTIQLVSGTLEPGKAVLSAEAAGSLRVAIGASVKVRLPDGSRLELPVSGIADLSRSRSLFSSRRGGDLETFVYAPNAVVVSPTVFGERVFPAFERASTAGEGRLKSPPIREVDISVERGLLDADPATAVAQTERIATEISAVAGHQDYLLDNITNALTVAADDSAAAKRLFVFLGLPGALLAAMLAAYAGNVLAETQRRDNALLRIRGASGRHLHRMLIARTTLLSGTGALAGLVLGYLVASAVLGQESLGRASASSLVVSGLIGTVAGLSATGLALYLTGRRSIDQEIGRDRGLLAATAPFWRRAWLDVGAAVAVVAGTIWAVRSDAFAGTPGSVYFGRAVELDLALLILPVGVWIAGTLLAARLVGLGLGRGHPGTRARLVRPVSGLVRRSVARRPGAIVTGGIVVALIVALATCLAAFTASYDAAKVEDARYANGADIRITPAPTATRTYRAGDAAVFDTPSVGEVTPVISGLSNVVLRSARTSDPANLVAIDPESYSDVAPVDAATAARLSALGREEGAILLSREMAAFLQAAPGDRLDVLLARATPDQTEVRLRIVGLIERLPGVPEGADAVMSIDAYTNAVPAKAPDVFLASTRGGRAGFERAVAELSRGPVAADDLQVDTRATTLDRDQSSLAALNIDGLVRLDTAFALAMATVTVAIFVFGLLLQRRREYVTLRAQGLGAVAVSLVIAGEAAAVSLIGSAVGLAVGIAMGAYFVGVLRPLFVLAPAYSLPVANLAMPVALVLAAMLAATFVGSLVVHGLRPMELLRDE